MKSKYPVYILVFITVGVSIFITSSLIQSARIEGTNKLVSLNGQFHLCDIYDKACIDRANERNAFLNDITSIGYSLEGSGADIIASINFPAFMDRTEDEKQEIIQKIKKSGSHIFTLGFASSYIGGDYSTEVKKLVQTIPFDDLRIRLYLEPENIFEMIDTMTWESKDKLKHLSFEFFNVGLPENLRIYDYIYFGKKMMERNNGNNPLPSFSLIFNPMYNNFSKYIDKVVIMPEYNKILRNFPTKELFIEGMDIRNSFGSYSTETDWKGRVEKFLRDSSIPNINIKGVAEKSNDKITIYP